MSQESFTAAVKWRVYATQGGIFLSLNGTPVFVYSPTVKTALEFSRSGQMDIPITLPPRQSVNSFMQNETAGQPPARDSNQLTLPGVPDAPTPDPLHRQLCSDDLAQALKQQRCGNWTRPALEPIKTSSTE